MDPLGSKVKKIKEAYKSGSDETTGLGSELAEKARNIKEGLGTSSPSEPVKSSGRPSPMKPVQGPYGSRPGEKRIDTSYPDSPMPKMHKGGMVNKTGPHMLLKGEAVLSKKDTKKMAALGGQESVPSDSPDGMSIDKMDDNTFQITHRHNMEKGETEPKRPTKFTARNVKHLVRHVRQHFGGNSGDGMAEPDSYENGGVVQKSGMAKVHKGETVVPAPSELGKKSGQESLSSELGKKVFKNPDISIGARKVSPVKPAPKYQPTPADKQRIIDSTGVV